MDSVFSRGKREERWGYLRPWCPCVHVCGTNGTHAKALLLSYLLLCQSILCLFSTCLFGLVDWLVGWLVVF